MGREGGERRGLVKKRARVVVEKGRVKGVLLLLVMQPTYRSLSGESVSGESVSGESVSGEPEWRECEV